MCIPKHSQISLCNENPLKQWTDKTMHGSCRWTSTMTLYFSPFDEISNKSERVKCQKNWHYFYRCNFFPFMLLEACRQMIWVVVSYCFCFQFAWFISWIWAQCFFVFLFAIVFGISLAWSEWVSEEYGYGFSSTTLVSIHARLFIYFWYFRFGIHYCL